MPRKLLGGTKQKACCSGRRLSQVCLGTLMVGVYLRLHPPVQACYGTPDPDPDPDILPWTGWSHGQEMLAGGAAVAAAGVGYEVRNLDIRGWADTCL